MHSLAGNTSCYYGTNHKEQAVLTGCHIFQITHRYFLNNVQRSAYTPCRCNYSFEHVLIDCMLIDDIRLTLYPFNHSIICMNNLIVSYF